MKQYKKSKRSSNNTSPVHRTLAATPAGLTFIRRFQNYLAKEKALPRRSKIIVAVSGGPDSMALLALLARLRAKHVFTLRAAHVNYQLRGRDADRDEALVTMFCRMENIPLSILRPKQKPRHNIEATLRATRYAFFERLRKRYRFDSIVTAHTQNDLAETLLMNLIRGSGAVGLSPFQRSHSRLVRPLLQFTRDDVATFLEAERIPWRLDKTNHSVRFTRNRIRHELLPLLATFNPSILTTLADTAKRLGRSTARK